jgi:hypothetical protein
MPTDYTVRGHVTSMDDVPLASYRVAATAMYTVVSTEEPSEEGGRPGHTTKRTVTTFIGDATTNANGEFAIPFDWERMKQRHEPDPVLGGPKVIVSVLEPSTNARVFKSQPTLAGTFFDIKIALVQVLSWQLHYPENVASYALGDIAMLSALVVNLAPRPISDFGLHVRMTPVALDDYWADKYKAGTIDVSVGLSEKLEAAGTEQTGAVRFDPNPLSRRPLAIAFEIPRYATAFGSNIPGGQYRFEPSGTFSIDATLSVEGRPAAWKQYTVTVRKAR